MSTGPRRRRRSRLGSGCRSLWLAPVLAAMTALAGCALFPYGTSTNVPLAARHTTTRATDAIDVAELDGGVFVGIALSGGGSRAANFSAAVLLELERLGFLQRASVVSSVSGSSLTAAYFGLFDRQGATDPRMWNEAELRRRLAYDLQGELVARWLLPDNLLLYWFTNFDRSSVMKRIFERRLFDGEQKTFGDLGAGMPKILINATRVGGRKFVFTDRSLERLGSDLGRLDIAEAVMASAAFPGALPSVTLTDFSAEHRFVHLFDGGASDNLAVETLEELVESLAAGPGAQGLRGCMFFVVDSTVDVETKREETLSQRPHTRSIISRAVDTNAIDAINTLMSRRRDDTLHEIGYPRTRPYGATPVWSFALRRGALDAPGGALSCHVWHIGFERLPFVGAAGRALAPIVNDIDTAFNLRGPPADADEGTAPSPAANARRLQQKLYEAAHLLVRTDTEALDRVRQLFADWFPDYR